MSLLGGYKLSENIKNGRLSRNRVYK